MDGEINRDPELVSLVELSRRLAARRVAVGLCDAWPALRVQTAFPGVQVHVYVSCSGESFTWQRADNRHPVSDLDGAAERIAAYVALWNQTQPPSIGTALGGERR